MAVWRFVKVILAALIIFIIANFFITNSAEQANSLATLISFKFNMPPFLYLQSIAFPVGYLLIISFILGMLLAALIGALNAFTRSREVKMKNKTIRELEREIDELRDALAREKNILHETEVSEESNRLPEQPEIR
ncbi:MAG TPA: hypothetical protein DF383_07885 [Deltaproteobacteria bacterium]|nr:hypothetical protein [Deltaproteobacteria bacterium]